MKKTIKDLFKLITAIATVAGILYVARDQDQSDHCKDQRSIR